MQTSRRINSRHAASCSRPLPAFNAARSTKIAALGRYPDPEFISQTQEAFFGGMYQKAVADAEEARVLLSNMGYAYLDVRPDAELEEVGRVKGSVSVPMVFSKRVWSSEEGKKVEVRTANEGFMTQVAKLFPDKAAALLLVGDADGKDGGLAMTALEALEEEGYENLVGLGGGYAGWSEVWDKKMARRAPKGAYVEDDLAPGSSQGMGGGIGG